MLDMTNTKIIVSILVLLTNASTRKIGLPELSTPSYVEPPPQGQHITFEAKSSSSYLGGFQMGSFQMFLLAEVP